MLYITNNFSLHQVSGDSMNPTFESDQIIFVAKNIEPKDNDIIILNTSYINNYEASGKHIIKRYYKEYSINGYYVLGDNSAVSYDSRYYGEAPKSSIEGVVLFSFPSFK